MAIRLQREYPRMSEDDETARSEDGRFSETVSPEDALAVFEDHEPLTAKEVAAELGASRRTALNKLTALADRGDIRRKEVGGRAVVFWKP